ncbi:MAG: polyprenyl synthetase family protein [Bacteroidales bacterium]
MSVLSNIRRPVEKEMAEFEKYFSNTMRSNIPLLRIVLNYILRRKGKQMRPMLVLLSSKLYGDIEEPSFVAATLIELLHTTSLVHDDVVDDAHERRGALSINALWNSKIAVLVGDYMLSRGLLVSVEKGRYDMLEIVSEAVKAMTEGELLQLQKSRKLNITEEDYFSIIRMKTAALTAACTECGAKAVTDDADILQNMKLFGETIGVAFQIRDDVLDYEANGFTGKPAGNDIKEKKITLPLIHVLQKCDRGTRNEILKIIRTNKKSASEVRRVVDLVYQYGGIDYAVEMMHLYRDKALAILDTCPPGDANDSLRQFVLYTTSRKK